MARLPDYYTPADKESIQRAYRVAEKAHEGQKRASGEPYVNHLLAVAAILAEYSMPADVVTAGLLHDTIEDTNIKADDLRRDFNDSIVNLVQGVTKLTQLPRVSAGNIGRRSCQNQTAMRQTSKKRMRRCATASASYPSRHYGKHSWQWTAMCASSLSN